jgi:hypothetical protein
VIVLVAVAHAAAVKDERVIEQRAVAVGRRLQLVEEVGQHLHVIAVDDREAIHLRARVGVMRRDVEALAHAALRIYGQARVARVHHRRDARDFRAERQRLQVVHHLEVLVERLGDTDGASGSFRSLGNCVSAF